jgi:hypothetical protein
MRCCVELGTGVGCEGLSTREHTEAGLVYLAVADSVKMIAFIVFGIAILNWTTFGIIDGM